MDHSVTDATSKHQDSKMKDDSILNAAFACSMDEDVGNTNENDSSESQVESPPSISTKLSAKTPEKASSAHPQKTQQPHANWSWPGLGQGQWAGPQMQWPTSQPGQPNQQASGPTSDSANASYDSMTGLVTAEVKHQELKDWEQGTCGCCEDVDVCVCGACCLPCLVCHNAGKLNVNLWIYYVVCCCLPCLLPCYVRSEARKRFNVRGSRTGDCLCGTCCVGCAMCQVAREIRHHEG